MTAPHQRAGQANTEYIVIIGLVAIGLIVAVGVVALVIKWNYSRSMSALAGENATSSEQVAQTQQDVKDEIARSRRGRVDISGFSEDGESSGSGTGNDALSGSGPNAEYFGGKPIRDPEPDVVSASSLQTGGGTTRSYSYDEESEADTNEYAAYVGGSRGTSGKRSGTSASSGSLFGFPWWVWIVLVLVLLAGFFLWATADQ